MRRAVLLAASLAVSLALAAPGAAVAATRSGSSASW
jgi:hypothetical protein